METPLIAARRRTFADRFTRRRPPPADPSPQELARILKEQGVHRAAAKRLDSLQAAETQHRDDRRAKACLMLGTAGLVLGLTPSLPAVHGACVAEDPGWECALRATALLGGFLALSSSMLTGWAIWHHRDRLKEEEDRLSQTLARAQKSRTGNVPIPDLFQRIRAMGDEERHEFTSHLHDHASEHRSALSQAAGNILAV